MNSATFKLIQLQQQQIFNQMTFDQINLTEWFSTKLFDQTIGHPFELLICSMIDIFVLLSLHGMTVLFFFLHWHVYGKTYLYIFAYQLIMTYL